MSAGPKYSSPAITAAMLPTQALPAPLPAAATVNPSRRGELCTALAISLALPFAAAAQATSDAGDDVFTLGQLTVRGQRPAPISTADNVATQQEMWDFNTLTLDDAVKLIPGVMTSPDSNGRRNEQDIFVRGFGRLQVPLSIDGVRIYLPADNRLDFRRFLTADLSEVQVSKGYVSVIDGPGAMGGAINLVTRRPTQVFETHFQAGVDLGHDGSKDAWNGYASVGSRQQHFYAHASVSYQDRQQWSLSDDYQPTSIQDRGDRNRSASGDSRVNLKFGYVPNQTDEYTINYTQQNGDKGAPLNVYNDPPNPPNSYWDWPQWDLQNTYFLSNTRFSDTTYLKTRLYYNTFDNVLYAYDDDSYSSQSNRGRFRSYYNDEGYGASVELSFSPLPANDTRLAAHWRSDRHAEYNINQPTNPTQTSREPTQHNQEQTWSLAVENTWHVNQMIDVLAGLSYDRNQITQAQGYDRDDGLFDYPTGGSDAWNSQVAMYWQVNPASRLGASLSSRTRFPTTFERYSTRFGNALPNPDLASERSTQLELSWKRGFANGSNLEVAVFHADVSNLIQTVVVDAGPPQLTQTRNVGDGRFYGLELGGKAQLAQTLSIGGNYTWLRRRIEDPLQPQYRPTGAPDQQALLYAAWSPFDHWSLMPNLEYASNRWNDGPDGSYLRTGQYTLANLQVQWDATPWIRIAVGGRNLLDDNYQLAWGFPEQGRSYYAKLQFDY